MGLSRTPLGLVVNPQEKSRTRSISTARHILDKPSYIVFKRRAKFIEPAQMVRIEMGTSTKYSSTSENVNMRAYDRDGTLFGMYDNPHYDNLNVEVGDTFGYRDSNYEITGVTYHAGEIQCAFRRVQR